MANQLYGIDISLRPDLTPVIFEFNGIESKADGFNQIYGDDRVINEVFRRMTESTSGDIFYSNARNFFYPGKWAEYARQNDIDFNWFSRLPREFNKKRMDGLVVGVKYDHNQVSKINGDNVVNAYDIERMTEEKALTAFLLQDTEVGFSIPQTAIPSNPRDVERILDHEFFCYKPILGYEGRGIKFLDRKQLLQTLTRDHGMSHMIQPCVDTIPIRSNITGKDHIGCARVIVYNGFVDAYWRLAGTPVGEGKNTDELVASFTQGGHGQAMSDVHKEIIANFTEKLVENYEREIKKCKIRDRSDLQKLQKKFYR